VAAFAVGSSSQALRALYGWFSGSLSIVLLNVIGTSLATSTIVVAGNGGQRFHLGTV
jgi:hypothetical protein